MNPLNLPHLASYVNDFSGIIGSDKQTEYNMLFKNHEEKTGEQVAVVLFPHREGNELLDIGLKVFNENGIGDKNLNNGLLLIVATEEKKLRIVVGKGLELKYTEMKCREIIENHLRPLLNEGKYEEMIMKWNEIVNNFEKFQESTESENTSGSRMKTPLINYPFSAQSFIVLTVSLLFSPILFQELFSGIIFFQSGFTFFLQSCILFGIFFGIVHMSRLSGVIKKSLTILLIAVFSIGNIVQNFVFSPYCQEYSTDIKIYADCSIKVFGKQVDRTFTLDYTQNFKEANPDKFQSPSNSSSSDSSWGGGSSNGGGWGD